MRPPIRLPAGENGGAIDSLNVTFGRASLAKMKASMHATTPGIYSRATAVPEIPDRPFLADCRRLLGIDVIRPLCLESRPFPTFVASPR
jgi:hypothetical protein